MEIIRGAVKLKDLFKSHWAAFFLSFFSMIVRPAIVKNVMKVIHCCTNMLGFHLYECPSCGDQTKVPHSCKSRFCPSCGKKATEQWMNNAFKTLPDCKWQHITFTIPRDFSELFRLNREVLFEQIPPIPNKLLMAQAKKKGIQPGSYMAIHTFGRSLNYNVHFHVSISMGGLTQKKKWKAWKWTYRQTLKNSWRYHVINTLRTLYKEGKLTLPRSLRIDCYAKFNKWLNDFYEKSWVVHFAKPYDSHERTTAYMGRYLKRPPIAEARILEYDGSYVTYEYLDHYTNKTEELTITVKQFIGRLIKHIPDENYRVIRYGGFLSNRLRGSLLPLVHKLIGSGPVPYQKPARWRQMFYRAIGYDPLKCYACEETKVFVRAVFPMQPSWEQLNAELIAGFT